MSTDIKPGQVWAWDYENPQAENVEFTIDPDIELGEDASLVAIVYPSGARGHYKPESIRNSAHLVKDVEATPAPLDPSKVAPKDRHPEQLARVRKQVHWATDLKRGDVIVSVEAHNAVTVEREEPAPEPEPEWKPGTVWADQEGERYWFTDDGSADGATFRNDVGDEYAPSEMGDVSALVVIDPAAARESLEVAGFDESTILSVSLLLGIEAP